MQNKNNKLNKFSIIIYILVITFLISPFLSVAAVIIIVILAKNKKIPSILIPKNLESLTNLILKNNGNLKFKSEKIPSQNFFETSIKIKKNDQVIQPDEIEEPNLQKIIETDILNLPIFGSKLDRKKKYLHIALNNTLDEAREIISQLPSSDRILIEAGTPLIKIYGVDAIRQIKNMAPIGTYIVADNKCADLANREVEMMAGAGANAVTCLGVAPIETIDLFIDECQKYKIDSIIDMMNVDNAQNVLKKLKNFLTL